jgi:HrpA-like RNA helicase
VLKRLESDSLLYGVTHLVIDQVHERTVDSDILLLLIRNVLLKRSDLK